MKFLIDKIEFPVELYPVYKKNVEYERYIRAYSYVFFCKQCGADLYSEFEFEKSSSNRVEKLKQEESDMGCSWKTNLSEEQRIERLKELRQMIHEVYENEEKARKNYRLSLDSAICPICGAKLHQEKGYFMPDGRIRHERVMFRYPIQRDNEVDTKINDLKDIRNKEELELANNSMNDYAQSCDIFVAGSVTTKTAEIKQNVESLKSYILNLIRLENNIYSLQQQLTDLYYRRMVNDRAVVFDTYSPAYQINAKLKELQKTYQTALEDVKAAEGYHPTVKIALPEEPSKPILSKPGLFNKKQVLANNEALMKRYHSAMDAYHQEIRRCEEERNRLTITMRNAAIEKAQKKVAEIKNAMDSTASGVDDKIKALQGRPVPARAAKVLLDQEITTAEELLRKSYSTRNELYAYGVIFDKYRNPVAISSFYEYLMSGRCSTLEGADGAYNIYESEVRANRVISQLDAVLSSLEDIKENQYLMYQEMQRTNALLRSLNRTMDTALTSIRGIEANTTQMNEYMGRVAENSDVIAHNTAVTAYYSKVNAELTNAMGFMMAYKL